MNERVLPTEARRLLAEIRDAPAALAAQRRQLERDIETARAALCAELERAVSDRLMAEELVRNRIAAIDLLADLWADYELALADAETDALRRKTRPAPKAAEAIRAKGRELARARRQAKLAQWTVALYEWHFPWLADLRDPEIETGYLDAQDTIEADEPETDEDPARRWLSAEEFRALPGAQRNQLALDRYLRSRKTPWELGRDYERYIGYLREQEGFQVSYQGIFKGLEDLGRDLIVTRPDGIEVVQCKRWAQSKTIHEKHIFQLFGTVTALRIDCPTQPVRGTFVTTTALSERARAFARQLEITVEEKCPLADYPRVKCNIGRGEERIYHLPFDQQYDTTVIERTRGEFYAETVTAAELAGFRRAWRWHRSS